MSIEIQDELLKYIAEQYRIDLKEIEFEENLVDQGVIDSFAFVEIATFLEGKFAIKIADDEIIAENFASISTIVTLTETIIASLAK